MSSILTAGTRTFVTLTEPRELRGKPYAWGAFKSEAEAQFAALHGPRRQAMRLGRELRFLQCPMPDGGVTSDEQLARLLAAILQELSQDRALYVHCYGGHGRAGIVGCSLLCLLFGLPPADAVAAFNLLHRERVDCGVGGPGQFPHSAEQQRQVERAAARGGPFRELLGPGLRGLLGRPLRQAGGAPRQGGGGEGEEGDSGDEREAGIEEGDSGDEEDEAGAEDAGGKPIPQSHGRDR